MSILVIDVTSSLDGYGAAEGRPGPWGLEGPEYLAWIGEDEAQPHVVLTGATTYRLMSGYAAEMPDHPGPAALTALPETVFSSTLQPPLSWAGTDVVHGDAVEAVRDLERRDPRPLRTVGSPSLCRSLLGAGVVGRLRVVVFPVITGATGTARLVDGYPDVALELVDSRLFDGRLQLLEYVPTVLEGPPGPADGEPAGRRRGRRDTSSRSGADLWQVTSTRGRRTYGAPPRRARHRTSLPRSSPLAY
jgi:dihydrofolate reductase